MLVKSTFFILLSSVISASIAAPVAQAPDAVSVSVTSALAGSTAAAPSVSADPANLDPVASAPGIDFGAASVPTISSVAAPLPVSSSIVPAPAPTTMILKPVYHPAPPPKHEPSPIHHTTSTVHHVPIYTPPVHHIPPPVHHTTSTIHHIPIYTPPVHHIPPPVHHTTSTLHHIPIYTPIKHELPVHHTTTLEHIPVHTPAPIHHIPPPIHTTPVHHVQPPVHTPPTHVPVHVPTYHSFDKWGGHESLKGFDNFYGVDNWDGYKFEQVFVKKEHELVCRTHEIHIIQQRLLVLQEMAKKIVVETICEVEVQTIVFEQFYAGLNGFGRDVRRIPGNHHQVGYDEEIVKHFPKIIKHDGTLDVEDWKFTGKDLGKHTVIVKGHNWDDKRSYGSVWKAWGAARKGWYDLYGKWF